MKASANAARNERARRQFLRRQRELEQEETKENAEKEAEARRRKAEENAKKEAKENAKKEAEARRRKAESNAKRKAEASAKKQAEAQRRKQKYANSNNVYKEAIRKLEYIKSNRISRNQKLTEGKKVFRKTVLILHPNKGGKEELFKKFSNYYNNFEKM